MAEPTSTEDLAQKPGICGVTTVGGTGIEWVCVREVHATVYQRHRRPDPVFQSTGNAEQHYFRPRWPGRSVPN